MFDSIFEKGLGYFISLSIATCTICMIFSRLIVRNIKRINEIKGNDTGGVQFTCDTVRTLIWGIGAFIIIGQIKPLKPLGDTLMGASGILAVSISLAAQTTLGNYISGFFLTIHKPFKVGDVVLSYRKGN